ncbi:MAG: hypothetical protein FJ161_03690 [Gammaproteobacteria bacterium]|nr:hypothetical protein [Gammaproteobacteria bacterium]
MDALWSLLIDTFACTHEIKEDRTSQIESVGVYVPIEYRPQASNGFIIKNDSLATLYSTPLIALHSEEVSIPFSQNWEDASVMSDGMSSIGLRPSQINLSNYAVSLKNWRHYGPIIQLLKPSNDTISIPITLPAGVPVTMSAGDGSNTQIDFPITGNGNVVKTGLGTMTLSSESSYTGGTVVTSGTLIAKDTAIKTIKSDILLNNYSVFTLSPSQDCVMPSAGAIANDGHLTLNATNNAVTNHTQWCNDLYREYNAQWWLSCICW